MGRSGTKSPCPQVHPLFTACDATPASEPGYICHNGNLAGVLMRLPLSFFMKSAFHSYLRKRRRQYGLSQDDIATILGVYSRSHVSMLETGDRRPSAEQVYILHLLFGEPDEQLFPGLFAHAKAHLADKLRNLLTQENPSRSGSTGRRKLLEEALSRLQPPGSNNQNHL